MSLSMVNISSDIEENKLLKEFYQKAVESIVLGTASRFGEDYFDGLVEHLAQALEMDFVFISKCDSLPITSLKSVATWKNGKQIENFRYDIENTPCDLVINKKELVYLGSGTDTQYPEATPYKGYIGIPLKMPDGSLFGNLAVLKEQPINPKFKELAIQVMKIFAGRVEAEIHRMEQEKLRDNLLKELQKRNEELQANNQILIEIDNEKNNLIRMVAHDMKSPLNQVEGLINVMSAINPEFNDENKQFIKMMKGSVMEMKSRIIKILDRDYIESGKLQISFQKVAIKPIIEKWMSNFDLMCQERKLGLSCNIADFKIRADKQFFSQVIQNVISNAIKYSNAGGNILIGAKEENESVLIAISDQGIGIKEEEKNTIFDKGKTTTAYTDSEEGSHGFGLYFTKRLVELMNGSIWFDSEEGVGTTFYIKLPKI